MSQVTNLAFFRARRGQSEELGDDADLWFVYENWHSPEGFDAHMLSEHLQAFLKATPDLIAGNIDLRRFRMISSPATRRI